MILTSLPTEVVVAVLLYLDVADVLNFRMTCKHSKEVSKSRLVWDYLVRQNIFEQNIPVPGLTGRSIASLSSFELEYYYERSLALRRNWHSDSPTPKHFRRLSGSPGTRIIRLHVPAGHQGLVSLAATYDRLGRFILKCWDIRPPTPLCVAQREFNSLAAIAVNKLSNVGCIAVLVPNCIEILSVNLNASHPSHGFFASTRIPMAVANILHFQGRRLIVKDFNQRLFHLNIDYPQTKIEFHYNKVTPMDFVLTDTFVLILKPETLELYPLPSSISAAPRHIVVCPIFAFQWPWRVDFGVMTLRRSFGDYSANQPITIFVRFGSGFPWANNVVHQYEVRPNAYFLSSEAPSELNVPYEFPPVQVKSIGSPVRLNAATDLAIGAYGTAIWIDTHTENYYDHAGRGQRIAGAFARLTRQDLDSEVEEGIHDQLHAVSTDVPFVYAHQEDDDWVTVALDEEEGTIFLGRADGAIDVLDYA